MSGEHELIALERRGWEALSSPDGAAYYREHLAPDAQMAFSFGVLTREQAIEAIAAAPPWSRFEMREPRVVSLGHDAGVVVYSVEAERDGQEPYSAVISSVFARHGGAWKLAFHQQTPA